MSRTTKQNFNKRSPKTSNHKIERHSTRQSLQNLIDISDTSLVNFLFDRVKVA